MKRGSERELANGFRRGSPEAVAEVRARVRRIVGFRGYRMPGADRQDLEQEVMTQIWRAVNRPGFDPERSFWGFVEVVTARRCIDWLRSRRDETAIDPEVRETDDGPLRSALARERVELARQALSRLSGPCRELIGLHVGDNRSYREIAALLGRSEGALRVRMHRCIREARRILGELTERARGDAGAADR